MGAMPSMPLRTDVDNFINKYLKWFIWKYNFMLKIIKFYENKKQIKMIE
jgi:hypothetical protein